jgi:predicted ATPase
LSSQYICRAELCLRLGKSCEAEADLEIAIDIAKQQEAKGWELRARLHLARLWANEGRFETAYQCLKSILGWFTEGLDTLDFNEAKALLEDLN